MDISNGHFEGKCNPAIVLYQVHFMLEYVPKVPDTAGGWVTLKYAICESAYLDPPKVTGGLACHDLSPNFDAPIHMKITLTAKCVKRHKKSAVDLRLWRTRYWTTAYNAHGGEANSRVIDHDEILPCVPKNVPGVDPSRR
ncbi:hypothetical protein HY857_02550 [Candidatus Saccharibacteria bacterium]|nr:hypothetical protein [Candidatus Saccharibacteria bacterium]